MRPAPPVPAATLLLVRDHGQLEVLMGRRHGGLRFGPGASVFPGGKLDVQDKDPAWRGCAEGWAELDPEDRSHRLCAVRETFEETGVLACCSAGVDVDAAAVLRPLVLTGELSFLAAVARLGLTIDLDALTPFARWITPQQSPIRFDAIFYIARAPADQVPRCDGYEMISVEWLTPSAALSLGDADPARLMRPTRATLQVLATTGFVDQALAAARGRPLRTVLHGD